VPSDQENLDRLVVAHPLGRCCSHVRTPTTTTGKRGRTLRNSSMDVIATPRREPREPRPRPLPEVRSRCHPSPSRLRPLRLPGAGVSCRRRRCPGVVWFSEGPHSAGPNRPLQKPQRTSVLAAYRAGQVHCASRRETQSQPDTTGLGGHRSDDARSIGRSAGLSHRHNRARGVHHAQAR